MYKDNFVREIPSNYKVDYTIDAKNGKVATLLTLGSLLLTVLVFVVVALIENFNYSELFENKNKALFVVWIFAILMLVYVVLHELTHGLFYKIYTHEKLKFGLTLTVAYCGVPNIYCNKKTMLVSQIAPFAIYTILSVVIFLLIPNNIYAFGLAILFAVHIGGCIGDLYGFFLLLFKYKNDVWINDNGYKQTYYVKAE